MTSTTQVHTIDTFSVSEQELTHRDSMPPPYAQDAMELKSAISATSSKSSLPEYDAVGAAGPSSPALPDFQPTCSLQIDNQGLPLIALPLPPRPYPIPVYAITESGAIGDKMYESIRQSRGSGNAILFRTGNPHYPVCSTSYRFGPGRPPKISLLAPDANVTNLGKDEVPVGNEEFEVIGNGCMTRAVTIRTHLGTFSWRYASKAERREFSADSLLVLDHVTNIALEGGKTEKKTRRVAQLVRNSEFRTKGSGRSTAGNGGRLMMDTRDWADRKDEAHQLETFIVASCIVMLKREMDRRRVHQAMVIGGGAGGGS
jgi:hypothetical protein